MKVLNDKTLDVALGSSRKAKTWKNRALQWSELLDRLASTTRTAETVAEFKAASRDRQSEIKDVGGFVGGYCANGNRSDVQFRSILCLDADFAQPGLWDSWCFLYGNAGAIYSTHKHTPEAQRLRLVVPLARNVDPEEYQAIGRRVAEALGIDQFDDTSYQAQRLMFWPSTSKDGEYVFEFLDNAFLDPDVVLSTYYDWRDVSAWPMSSRVSEIAKRSATKQKDPLEKKGLLGAFCRAYSIEDAIEAFIPEYVPCDVPGRYTYTEGSTAAGVIVYDGRFSYSHHATDPASCQLCNAWDLVRLHKFGDLDADVDPATPATSRPSYKAMQKFAAADARVASQVAADRVAQASDDFADVLPDVEAGVEAGWTSKLKITDKGVLAQTIENVVIILSHDPKLAGALAFNEMSHAIVVLRSLPWRTVTSESQWIDSDDAALRYYLERVYGLSGKDKIFDAVNVVATQNSFHPVKTYLEGCAWDGVPRLETLLIDYLGADDNDYTRAVTRKAFIAAVARVYRPGCKFDYMLVLRGRQGIGKSALISKLGGSWFSDSFTTLQGKDAYEQVQGVWIMEVGELAGMRKAEAETIKLYISKQSDRFRPAYGRRLQEFPRQCIFIGTTNETQFLRDSTGNRRFWVVDTPHTPARSIWEDLSPSEIALIWGETVAYFKKGEALFLPHGLEAAARKVQEAFEEESPRAGVVCAYLDRTLPADWSNRDLFERRTWLEGTEEGPVVRDTVSTIEIWAEALGGNPEKIDRLAVKEIRDIMARQEGWAHQGSSLTSTAYGRQRFYKREG